MLLYELGTDMRPRVEAAFGAYFAARTVGPWAISTSRAIPKIRAIDPLSELTDRDLADLIANYAASRHISIVFDFDPRK